MSTVFFNDAVKVDINKGEQTIVTSGADLRNVLLTTSHTKFTDAFRSYSNLSELSLDGFTEGDFAYRFARQFFDSAVDIYNKPKLLITGGLILANSPDYIFKIQKALGKTNNFGFIITDIRYRTDTDGLDEHQFIFDIATFVETTEKFFPIWLDLEYTPDLLVWITTNNDEVVLTDTPTGLMAESSTKEFT